MAGVSVGFAKCFILFMAIVILLQGVIYLGLSIWGLTLRTCNTETDISNNPFKFAMDLIYFVEEDCGNPQLSLQGESFDLQMDWSKSYEVTQREYIFMITYAAVSGLWVVTSLFIITTLCSTTTKVIAGVVYWPWFLMVLAGSILDIVATVFHSMDINKTLTLDDTFAFIGAEKPDVNELIWAQIESFGAYFCTPAILLTCLSCRVVLIWLLNIFGSSFCLSLSRILAKQHTEKQRAKINSPSQAPTRQQTPQPMLVAVQQPTAPLPTPQPQLQAELHEEYPEQIRPKPLPIIIPAHNAEMMQSQQNGQLYQSSDRTTLQSPVVILPPPQQSQQQANNEQQDFTTYRTTEAHHDRLNYPPSDPNTPVPRAPSPAVQQLAATSPLNDRYAEMYPTQVQPHNARVSVELRNQMPWSYTSMSVGSKPPPPPRKPQQQVQIYPQIPEPDYHEH